VARSRGGPGEGGSKYVSVLLKRPAKARKQVYFFTEWITIHNRDQQEKAMALEVSRKLLAQLKESQKAVTDTASLQIRLYELLISIESKTPGSAGCDGADLAKPPGAET
jgi:hypothetical protein